jgi:hypothetical protein
MLTYQGGQTLDGLAKTAVQFLTIQREDLSLSLYFGTKPEKGKFVCRGFSEIRVQPDCLNFKKEAGYGELNPPKSNL